MDAIKWACAACAVLVVSSLGGCLAPGKVVGSDGLELGSGLGSGSGSAAGGSNAQAAEPAGAPLGAVCMSTEERRASFAGWSMAEISVDDHASQCSTGVCLQNHFQGRVSCPYGQAAGEGACLAAGGQTPVSVAVEPQLVERRAALASICSCRCAGPGPGPYCTCPEQMQCEDLVPDLGIGDGGLAGSYCIPKGSQYEERQPRTECVEPNCGLP